MGNRDEIIQIDALQKPLIDVDDDVNDDDTTILYAASFNEAEEKFVKYQTARWVLYSLLLVLAWGFGVLMLLYLPVRRYVLRKEMRSRKLYLTPNSIVYKVTRPVPFPCFGVLKKEKHVLLSSVADVVIEQGYLQSRYGVYSLRVENVGVRRPPSDDVQIQGIANPSAFRKAVLMRLSSMKSEAIARQISPVEDNPNLRISQSPASWMSQSKYLKSDGLPASGDQLLLQKLDEVENSIKRVQTIVEEQYSQASETVD